ncbi:MAG: hypothetical protein EBX32_06875, partial [Burkholderiaceae bacterium]|nr:hypothetical protein [Burkholderiaceae bacterium]
NSFTENGTLLSTKYQIADATLCALGDLTLGSNQLLYFDAGQNPALSTLTANARALLDDANYSFTGSSCDNSITASTINRSIKNRRNRSSGRK